MNTSEIDYLEAVLNAPGVRSDLTNDWEKNFLRDTADRLEKYGMDTHMSVKQWDIIHKIAAKVDVNKDEYTG